MPAASGRRRSNRPWPHRRPGWRWPCSRWCAGGVHVDARLVRRARVGCLRILTGGLDGPDRCRRQRRPRDQQRELGAGVGHDLARVEARGGGGAARPEVVGRGRVALVELERRRGREGEVRLLVLGRDGLGQPGHGEAAERAVGAGRAGGEGGGGEQPEPPATRSSAAAPRTASRPGSTAGGRPVHAAAPPRYASARSSGRSSGLPEATMRPCTTTATSVATLSAVAANCSARMTATPSAAIWATRP